jgi:hypothetical protein
VAQFFPAQNPDWGDIFLDQEKVSSFKAVTVATSASCVG